MAGKGSERSSSAPAQADTARAASIALGLATESRRRTVLTPRGAAAILDGIVLLIFLLYATHVVVSPVDSQVAVERQVMKVIEYGQLINGTYGQVFFLLYVGLRTAFFPDIYRTFLSALGGLSLFAVLSAAWSIDPIVTIHRALDLVLCVIMPAIFVRALGFEQCVRATWIILSTLLLISALLALSGSDYALMRGFHDGLWRGLFDHKNSFAPVAAVIAILTFMAPLSITGSNSVRLAVTALAVASVGLSGSATAGAALFIAAIVIFQTQLCQRLRLSTFSTWLVMVGSIIAGALTAVGVVAAVLKFLGRNMTLTGRTGLWEGAFPYTISHPFGFGYGMSGGDEVMNAARLTAGWMVAPSLHSGYLTLAIDLGWGAVIVFLGWLLSKMTVLAWRDAVTDRYLLAGAGMAAINITMAFTESPFGPYLNAPLMMLVMLSHARRGIRPRSTPRPSGSVLGALD